MSVCVGACCRERWSKILSNVLGSCCSRKSNELVGTSRKLHCDVCVCVMHHVCLTVSLLVPLGPLMNRHALPIEVKVMAVISTRHGHRSVL